MSEETIAIETKAAEAARETGWGIPDELPVLPGHGPRTTVGRERARNPFLVEL